jgi:hypothetical protein
MVTAPPPLHPTLGAHFAAICALFNAPPPTHSAPPPAHSVHVSAVNSPALTAVPTEVSSSSVSVPESSLTLLLFDDLVSDSTPSSAFPGLHGVWLEYTHLHSFLLVNFSSLSLSIKYHVPSFPITACADPLMTIGTYSLSAGHLKCWKDGKWSVLLSFNQEEAGDLPELTPTPRYFKLENPARV